MFIPKAVFDLFRISKESVEGLRETLAAITAERDLYRSQLLTSQNHFDWLRLRVNALEVERAQLIEKAYGIKTVVPEIANVSDFSKILEQMSNPIFEDMGDAEALKQGLPVYGN